MQKQICQAVFIVLWVFLSGSYSQAQSREPLISAELKAITTDWYNLPNKDWAKVDSVFQRGLKNPYIKLMYDQMVKATIGKPKKPFKIRIRFFPPEKDPNKMESLGKYRDEYFYDNSGDTQVNGMLLNKKLFYDKEYKKKLMVTFFAKFINAYQQTVYRSEYRTLKEKINLETEQRFFIEFIEYTSRNDKGETLFGLSEGYSFFGSPQDQKKLETWLEEIKKSPTHVPTLENTKQKYLEFFIPRFQEVWKDTGYGSLKVDSNEILYAVLMLFP
jgi:hypothetical protein